MNLARESMFFLGTTSVLVGIMLAAGARRHVEDILSWERQWRHATGLPEPEDQSAERKKWLYVYRFGGSLIIGIGAGLFYGGATGLGPASLSRNEAIVGGISLVLFSVAGAWWSWTIEKRRGPRFLDGELLAQDAPLPAPERIAVFCNRAVGVLFLTFGLRLLREGLR